MISKDKASGSDRPRVVDTRPAGEGHAVVSVAGGTGVAMSRPCVQCPWRRSNDGSFPAEAFRQSANTAYDASMSTFACHMTMLDDPLICAGSILASPHNLALRIKEVMGDLDPGAIDDDGADLHPDYRSMAIANGVGPDEEVLKPCR